MFLTIALLMFFSTSAMAAEVSENSFIDLDICKRINSELNNIEIIKENYGLQNIDFDTLSVSNPINAYEYINNELMDAGFSLYALTSEGNLVAFMIKNNETNTYQFTIGLVNGISTSIKADDSFAIIYDKNNCYAYSLSNGLIVLNSINIDNNRDILDKNNLSILSNAILNKYSPVQLLGYSNTETDLVANETYTNSLLSLSNYSYLNVSYVSQGANTNYCWASSDACIGNYLTSRNLSGEYVAYLTYGSDYNKGADIYTAMTALNTIYGISYNYYYSVPSITTMYSTISNGHPIYSVWEFGTIGSSHAMVIYGVNTSVNYLYLMDPLIGFSSSGKVGSDFVYTSTYTGYTMYLRYVGY